MGMSASQARYLSLTARKSDLEFRGQQINQSRLMLSNQSANLYSSMLSMSVPTPPVETDFMKDVYTFSLGGDSTTLSSYKLSMGKDGYGYDILYSKPATTNQLTASSVSGVQRAISRKASEPTKDQNTISNTGIKVATKYDDSKAEQPSAPEVTWVVTSATSHTGNYKHDPSRDFSVNNTNQSLYMQLWGTQTSQVEESKKKTQNNQMSTPSVKKMTFEGDNIRYDKDKDDCRKLKKLDASSLVSIFGGSCNNDKTTYTYTGSMLSRVLSGFGVDNKVTIGLATGDKNNSEKTKKAGNVQFYIDTTNMKLYILKCKDNQDGSSTIENLSNDSGKFDMYEYDISDLLGLKKEDSFENQADNKKNVYSYTTGKDANTEKKYVTLEWNDAANDSLGNIKAVEQKLNEQDQHRINDKVLVKLDNNTLEEKFGIKKNDDIIPSNSDEAKEKDKLTYQYFRDSSTGDIWQLCTTTAAKNGAISESWRLFKPNKTYTFDGKEAQLLDKKDWPENISYIFNDKIEYDCYYVPDETGTGGSYYMVKSDAFTYGNETTDSISNANGTRYEANNTYKIEGLTARVVSEKDIPSTILDAYSKDDYIVYATYNDKDTDFSNPVKYYIYPKDDDAAEAVCAYAYEKSYTGKNEILQGRANILVDENGRLAKIDILNQGTYALEYGQEKDEDAYNEAYREYEYKLEKYEKEMADIDARTAMIQQQDKKLELQLKSIDTEHSAIQTELEALKKVIDTNIKSSFGTFGG